MDNVVIITGAGFSAPANIPIQNGILKEIISRPKLSILSEDMDELNFKFLASFIEVGFYLLNEYFGVDISHDYAEYKQIKDHVIINSDSDDYMYIQLEFKEKIRKALEDEHLANKGISLEDVFTSLDKAVIKRTHNKNYSYIQLDKIRHSILRLFVYYFERCIQEHGCTSSEYFSVINYLKSTTENISFITTNWDTIFEKYMDENKIRYDLCFSDVYFKYDTSHYQRKTKMPFIKIHGSLDWYRCLTCDTLLILKKETNKKFIFDDKTQEKCINCATIAQEDCVQLEPEIITPSMIKSIAGQLYANLWKSASDKLSKADKVIFIGYSLPVADYEFRYLLKRSIKRNAQIDVVLIEKDDPSKITKDNEYLKWLLPETRYKELFGTSNINFYYKGFESYFTS